ncbi:MAG: ferritin-like domain-containing protein, partial [Lawsonella sp.]
MSPQDDLGPLSKALEAEYAAIFGYGVVSAYISGTRNSSVAKVWSAHRARRNRILKFMRTNDLTPPEPELAYTSEKGVWDNLTAIQLAARIEEDCAVAWSQALQNSVAAESRKLAVQALLSCVEWVARWRIAAGTSPAVDPLPGLKRLDEADKDEVSPGTSPDPEKPSISTPSTTEDESPYEDNDLSGYEYWNNQWDSYDGGVSTPTDSADSTTDSTGSVDTPITGSTP